MPHTDYIHTLMFAKLRALFAAAVLLLTTTSCLNDNDTASSEVSVVVQLTWQNDNLADAVAGRTITLTAASGRSYTAVTSASGTATFSVIPDVYSISTAWDMPSATEAGIVYTIAGTLTQLTIDKASVQPLLVSRSRQSALLVSKVYYAGSKDTNNRNYLAGRFLEIYNNSADTLSVAGLYIGLVESESAASGVVYPYGQTPDSIYLKQVFRIPTNTTKRLLPGQALVIANSAIDHSAANAEGYERNLTTADFEAKQARATNNPDVPALDLIYTTYPAITQLNLTQGGLTSIVLFNAPTGATFTEVYKYQKSSGSRFVQLPTAWVVDAVEVLRYNATAIDVKEKRLYPSLDAGYAHITAVTGYTGESIVRRVASTTPTGRKVLVDTNNSTNDFTQSKTLPLRAY